MSKKQLLSKPGRWQIILHDDNKVHVDHVIDCLMDICAHNYIQSVQCAHIVHNSGRCSIYVDVWDECDDVRNELHHQGLTVTIEKYKKHV
jgi:ATP-dependent Clp protease adaptor protein ClpS